MQRNDILWKGLIEDLFLHFIPFFLPRYEHLFDLSRPVVFMDKELQQLFPQEGSLRHPKFVDKLVKVHTTDGAEQWVLIHIEVQGQQDKAFARRMFTYFYRILDKYDVAVTAIAIFTDDSPAFVPAAYVHEFAGTRYTYQFNTYKVLQQQEEALIRSNNPFAIAVLTVLLALRKKRLAGEELLQLKVELYRQLRSRNFSQPVARSLFFFLEQYVHFDKPEWSSRFDREIDLINGNTETMGIEDIVKQMIADEAREVGIEQEKANRNTVFVTNLIQSTDFPDEKIATLADVPVAFVQQIRNEIKQ